MSHNQEALVWLHSSLIGHEVSNTGALPGTDLEYYIKLIEVNEVPPSPNKKFIFCMLRGPQIGERETSFNCISRERVQGGNP